MQNFEMSGYYNNKFDGLNPNMISRVRNTIIAGIKQDVHLLKMIVVVLDDDLIKYLNFGRYGFSEASGRLVSYLMSEFGKIIESHNERLPKKAIRKDGGPTIVWIQPPLHKNFANNHLRIKFAKVCDEMAQLHPNNVALALKKGWDEDDDHMYLQESRRYTHAGLGAYWQAVDRTIKYADNILLKKLARKPGEAKRQSKTFSRYHWHRDISSSSVHRREHCSKEEQRKMPTPPPKRRC